MSSEQRELLRRALLRVLDANRTRFGLQAPALCLVVGRYGFTGVAEETVLDQIEYLSGKGLVEEVLRAVSSENRAWRITKAGLAFVDSNQ